MKLNQIRIVSVMRRIPKHLLLFIEFDNRVNLRFQIRHLRDQPLLQRPKPEVVKPVPLIHPKEPLPVLQPSHPRAVVHPPRRIRLLNHNPRFARRQVGGTKLHHVLLSVRAVKQQGLPVWRKPNIVNVMSDISIGRCKSGIHLL